MLLTVALVVALQTAPSAAPGAQPPPSQTPSSPAQSNAPRSTLTNAQFSPAIADELLRTLRSGLLARNPRQFLSAFDAARFPDYNLFSGRVEALFARRDSFRIYFRLLQTSTNGTRAVALVESELEMNDRDSLAPPLRRTAQLRLELERSAQGWRIVALTPSDFFTL